MTISLISGPTPAPLSSAFANPTASAIYSLGGVWNGATWDRQVSASGDAISSTGLSASGNYVFNGTNWDRMKTSSGATGTSGVGLLGVGLLGYDPINFVYRLVYNATGDAMQTTNVLAAGNSYYNGTTWDRGRSVAAAAGGPGTGVQAVSQMQWDSVGSAYRALWAPGGDAASSSNLASSGLMVFNGTNWDRARSWLSGANSSGTGVAAVGPLIYDSSTSLARVMVAATSDSMPFGIVAVGNMAFNGTNWDRVRSANTASNTSGAGLLGAGSLVYDGANWQVQGGFVGDAGQNAALIAGNRKEISFSTAVTAVVASTDVSNYRSACVQVNTLGTGAIVNFQGSNDNVNWFSIGLSGSGTTAGAIQLSTGSTGIFYGPVHSRYFRLNVTGQTAGTTAGTIEFYSMPPPMPAMGTSTVLLATGAQGADSQSVMQVPNFIFNGANWDRWRTASADTMPAIGMAAAGNMIWNGTTWDRRRSAAGAPIGTAAVAPMATSTGGATQYKLTSAATTNLTSLKASAGSVYVIYAINATATARYIKFFDKASAPVIGTDVPTQTFMVPPNTFAPVAHAFAIGKAFVNGIAFAITANIGDADTTAIGAGDVVLNIDYK